MGGFAYDVSEISDNPYIALTPKGFMEFVHAEIIIPYIVKDDNIADRSKEDSLGKLLVFVQALWMVVNCIARKLSEKPTTLIELNVIVQCSQPSLPTAGEGSVVRHNSRTDRTAPRPSVPSSLKTDGMSAVIHRHRAVIVYLYT